MTPEGRPETPAEWMLHPQMRDVLRRTVGLMEPSPDEPLHVKLVEALVPLGPSATLGEQIVAARQVFNWEHLEAGPEFATAKTAYEAHVAKLKVGFLAGDTKMSVAKAEAMAEADDRAYELKLRFLLAEQRERGYRKFLETLDRALENHRTDRADWRAADRAHADGFGGGS